MASQDEVLAKLESIEKKLDSIQNLLRGTVALDSASTDEVFPQALVLLNEQGSISTSLLQRRLSIGYARAARLIDQLQERGHALPKPGTPGMVVKI